MTRGLSAAFGLLLLPSLLAACSAAVGGVAANPTLRQAASTPAPPVSVRATNFPTFTPTVAASGTPATNSILIWWPAPLYPRDKPEQTKAAASFNDQIETYERLRARTVIVREKPPNGPGGIYDTLRSGSVVAPAIMPDLALMRRGDLIQAVANKLIEPIDQQVLAADDLFGSALALGQVHGTLYGVPYTLEIQHTVFRTSALASPPHTLDALLQVNQVYYFPASAPNITLLAMYLAAGGRITDDQAAPVLDREPLAAVLSYYEKAAAARVAGPQLLDYTSASQYWPLFASGKASIVQVDSTTFLAQRSAMSDVDVLPIPMPTRTPVALLDAWMWVITTGDPGKQAKALDMLSWLLRPDQQGRFTHDLGVLPSRRLALEAWGDDSYATFAETLLSLPAVPPVDQIPPLVTGVLQKAFEDVLAGRRTAEAAADEAIAQVSGIG